MKQLKRFAALLLAAVFCGAAAFAFDFEVYGPDDAPEAMPKSSAWATDELKKAQQADLIVNGLGDDYTKNISRSQFARLVVNMTEKALGAALPTPAGSPFADTSDEWVLKANAAGIVQGISDTAFNPDANITREQIATMFYRAIAYLQQENKKAALASGGDLSAYSDAGQVSAWAKDAVTALAHNDIMKGTSDTQLAPQGTATIEQSILLVVRVYEAQ